MDLDKKDENLKEFLEENEIGKRIFKSLLQDELKPIDEKIENINIDFKHSINKIDDKIMNLRKQIEIINKDVSDVLEAINTFETKNNSEFNKIENMVSTVLSEQNKLFPLLKKNTNEIEKKIDLKINEIEQEIIDEIERYFLMEHFYTHVCAVLDSSKRLSKIKKYFTMELPDLLKSEKFVIENNVIVEMFKESVKESKHWWGVSVPELREILKHKLYIIFHEKF